MGMSCRITLVTSMEKILFLSLSLHACTEERPYEKTVYNFIICNSRKEFSPGSESVILILDSPVFRIMRNKFLLFQPLSIWHFERKEL